MQRKILILGASYGSLLGTKLAMAGHHATLVCRAATAGLIDAQGTHVRIRLKGEDAHRTIRSVDLPGRIDASTPRHVDPARYDLVVLAMQEPQYAAPEIRAPMRRIARAAVPCLSLMNMPPPPYLRRIPALDADRLESAYTDGSVWDSFEPGLVTLCSPDPQAFRPPDESANVLHVGLPTNFKAAAFADPAHTAMLEELARDIDGVRLDGKEVPVKLRVHDSLFVPLAKWAMLLAGNYRCVTFRGERSISQAIHDDPALSREVYDFVNALARRLGAEPSDLVPFEKYAAAAQSLAKPSSAARAIAAGALDIERVDRLVRSIGDQLGMRNTLIDSAVRVVDARLAQNADAAVAAMGERRAA